MGKKFVLIVRLKFWVVPCSGRQMDWLGQDFRRYVLLVSSGDTLSVPQIIY